jgi:hypothetical protein
MGMRRVLYSYADAPLDRWYISVAASDPGGGWATHLPPRATQSWGSTPEQPAEHTTA